MNGAQLSQYLAYAEHARDTYGPPAPGRPHHVVRHGRRAVRLYALLMAAVLGISAYYHDAAAALVVDGDIVAAAQEERFTRVKHDPSFPSNAIRYCLNEAGVEPEDLDAVGFYEKPFLKLDRLLETYLAYAPRGFRQFVQFAPAWTREKLRLPREIARGLGG